MRAFWRARRGVAGVMIACAMPLLVGIAAFAIDVGTIALDSRRLQGIADAAALAAAGDPNGTAAAHDLVAASWTRPVTLRLTPGSYVADPAVAPERRFSAAASGDAARAEVETRSPTLFASVLGVSSVRVVRSAMAQRRRFAAFSLGSRLIDTDASVVNKLLAAFGINAPALSVLDHRELGEASVDVFEVLALLRAQGTVAAGTYGAQLATEVPLGRLFDAMATVLSAKGDSTAAVVMRMLAAGAPARSIALGALVDAGPLSGRTDGGSASLPALTLLTAALRTGGPREVALDLAAGLPGIASTRVWIATGERAQHSPLVAITDTGEPVLRTAQARVLIRVRLAPTLLPGLSSLASVEVPLLAEVAGAEARLRSIGCPPDARAATLEGRVDPASLSLGSVDETRLDDFATALAPQPAKLLDTAFVDVTGSSRVSLGAAEPWRSVTFHDADIAARKARTIAATAPVGGVAGSLLSQPRLTAQVIGLPIAIDPLVRAIGALLSGVAPTLDRLLLNVLGALGIGFGEADLAVTSVRCNGAVLVG